MAVTDQELAQAMSAIDEDARIKVLQRAADLVLDRHINESSVSDLQIRSLFSGKSDEEIAAASQALLDKSYNFDDGDINVTISNLMQENGVTPQPATVHPDQAQQPVEPDEAQGETPEPTAVAENSLTRDSLEAIAASESFSPVVRESAQGILNVADQNHGGNVEEAVAALREESNEPATQAILNGDVSITTQPIIDREAFSQAFEGVENVEPLSDEQDAELRATYQEVIESGALGGMGNVDVMLRQVMNYADVEHDGSVSRAINALGEMEPDQAYDKLGLNNITVTMTAAPMGFENTEAEPSVGQPEATEQPAPDVQPAATEQPVESGASVEEARLDIPQSGMTVAEISAAVGSIPANMITRERLEDISQNGVPQWQASMIGMSPEEAQTMAQQALAVTDARFDGDVNAAMAFLRENGNNPEYANLTAAQLSQSLAEQPEVVQQAAATSAATPETQAAASTPEAAQAEARRAEMRAGLSEMFNGMGMTDVANSLDSNNPMEFIMAIFSALTGQTFSISNDSTAFAGLTTQDGQPVPTGTQVDPNSGEQIADTTVTDPDVVPGQQAAVVGMRA